MIPIPSGVRVWIAPATPTCARHAPAGANERCAPSCCFALLEGLPAEVVVMADAAYDADHLRQAIAAKAPSSSTTRGDPNSKPVGGRQIDGRTTECRCAVLEAKML